MTITIKTDFIEISIYRITTREIVYEFSVLTAEPLHAIIRGYEKEIDLNNEKDVNGIVKITISDDSADFPTDFNRLKESGYLVEIAVYFFPKGEFFTFGQSNLVI